MAARTNPRANGRHASRGVDVPPQPTAPAAPPPAAGDGMPPEQRVAYLEALVRTMQEQLADANAKAAHAHTLARLNEDAAKSLDSENRRLKSQLAGLNPKGKEQTQ